MSLLKNTAELRYEHFKIIPSPNHMSYQLQSGNHSGVSALVMTHEEVSSGQGWTASQLPHSSFPCKCVTGSTLLHVITQVADNRHFIRTKSCRCRTCRLTTVTLCDQMPIGAALLEVTDLSVARPRGFMDARYCHVEIILLVGTLLTNLTCLLTQWDWIKQRSKDLCGVYGGMQTMQFENIMTQVQNKNAHRQMCTQIVQ